MSDKILDDVCATCGRSIYDDPDYFWDRESGAEWGCHDTPSPSDDSELNKKWIEIEGAYIRTHGADQAQLIELPSGYRVWAPIDQVKAFHQYEQGGRLTVTINALFAVKRGLISRSDERIRP